MGQDLGAGAGQPDPSCLHDHSVRGQFQAGPDVLLDEKDGTALASDRSA
jgi:hypothetical protein